MTLSDVGVKSVRSSVVKAVWVAIALFIMYMAGWHELLKERLGEVGFVILAFFVLLAIIFVLNVLSAPAMIQKESDDLIDALRRQIDDKQARQAALNALWRLRSEGISMRNDEVLSDRQFVDWQQRFNAWRENVLLEAEKVNVNLKFYLERLDQMRPPPGNIQIFNPEHGRLAHITSEILQRLQEYLKKEL